MFLRKIEQKSNFRLTTIIFTVLQISAYGPQREKMYLRTIFWALEK